MSDWSRVFEGSQVEADLVVAILESAGIKAVSAGGFHRYAADAFYDSSVYVPADRAAEAEELLRDRG